MGGGELVRTSQSIHTRGSDEGVSGILTGIYVEFTGRCTV